MSIVSRATKGGASFLLNLNTSVARGLPTAVRCLATVGVAALMCASPAYAQSSVTANFTRGAIAEYTNNPNGTDRAILFGSLNITGISISQTSANGQWGGSQGNDAAVTATITFTNGTTQTFPAAINWVKNAGGGNFDWVGLTIGSGVTVNDGYTPTTGFSKTYILQFPQSSYSLSSGLPNGLDGSANTGAALNALNQYFPNATPPVITGPSGGAGSSASAISVNENQTAVTTLTADKAVTWAITGGADSARFQISAAGVITFNASPDFEVPTDSDTNNTYLLTVQATDGNGNTSAQTITVTVLDLDETAPVVTAGQSFSYAENQAANTAVGTLAASDATGVTGFRFTATGTATSADGFYAIDAAGAITLTTAGAAAGAATNDFETAPNSFTYAVQARDAAGNWSAAQNVTLTVTDLNELAPVITGPSGGAGSIASAISVNENQTAVTTLTADMAVTWAITGGADSARFQISAAGVITFNASPDFEVPTDSDTNNTYLLTVSATDGNGNTSSQTITVTVLDLDETAPVISGAGGTGQPTAAISVPEGGTEVTTVTASEAVTWAIAGGNDGGKFQISASGVITFTGPTDFEAPTDSDTNNTYTLVIEATDSNGNTTAQTITVTVLDLDDTAPVISGAGGTGQPTAAISVPEGTTAVTTLTASEAVTWAIAGGNDSGQFQISASGVITFTGPTDFEAPTDSDTNNTYTLVIEATDGNCNTSSQTITVTVLDLDDTAPVITGASGTGQPTAAISVPEGTTAVTTLTASEAVTWAIVGGNDGGRFQVSPSGVITFTGSPDFEAPTDSDTNNTYTLVIEATDVSGNKVQQTVTVTVTDVDDTGPLIAGPSGAPGAANAGIVVPEGQTAVTTLSADEAVTWSIIGGDDAGRFTISAAGAITFVTPTDFENPTDANRNNTYILQVRAVDRFGNVSVQTITVSVANIDEIGRKLEQIGGDLRGDVRNHAFGSLTTMLAFNEGLLADSGRDGNCAQPERTKTVSGSANANETAQQGGLRLHRRLNACQSRTRLYGDAAVALSRFNGNWTARTLASLRVEYTLNDHTVVGAAVVGSVADDHLNSFSDSRISDRTVQLTGYGRVRISGALRFAAFGGIGKAWYDFRLSDGGLGLTGKATGNRHFYGAALSGDIPVAGVTITTDVILSRAVERLGGATLAASYLGENRTGIVFALGTVDVTRLSVPVHIPVTFGRDGVGGSLGRFDFSPGLLCEDTSAASSSLTCGYQLGVKLLVTPTARLRLTAEARHEEVEGYRTELFTVSAMYRFGPLGLGAVGIDLGRQMRTTAADNRVVLRLKIGG